VDEKIGKEEHPPTKLDPARINETPSNLVSLIYFVIPNCAVISHAQAHCTKGKEKEA
jgi:hypothetical protein